MCKVPWQDKREKDQLIWGRKESGKALRRECLNWACEKWIGASWVEEGRDFHAEGTGMKLPQPICEWK